MPLSFMPSGSTLNFTNVQLNNTLLAVPTSSNLLSLSFFNVTGSRGLLIFLNSVSLLTSKASVALLAQVVAQTPSINAQTVSSLVGMSAFLLWSTRSSSTSGSFCYGFYFCDVPLGFSNSKKANKIFVTRNLRQNVVSFHLPLPATNESVQFR